MLVHKDLKKNKGLGPGPAERTSTKTAFKFYLSRERGPKGESGGGGKKTGEEFNLGEG